MITNQRDLRRTFWEHNSTAQRRKLRDGDYATDTRVLFCDFLDDLVRQGTITEALANRATL